MRGEAEVAEQRARLGGQQWVGIDRAPGAARQAFAFEQRQFDLSLHRQVRRQRRDLEGARQARTHPLRLRALGHILACQHHLPGARREHTADKVDEGRLTRAVGADQREAIAGMQLQRHTACDVQAAEVLVECARLQHRGHGVVPMRARSHAQAFCGGSSTTTIRAAPTMNNQWYGLIDAAV